MPFDKYGYEGEGTLKEYFLHKPVELPDALKGDADAEAFEKELDDRDSAIDRLCLQLFSELSGVSPDQVIIVKWLEDESGLMIETDEDEAAYEAEFDKKLKALTGAAGYNLVGIHPDDPVLMLFKDGQPISAFYASYRGVYQAGAYVVATDKHYFAHNFLNSEPQDTWIDDGDEGRGCASVAHKYLMEGRLF